MSDMLEVGHFDGSLKTCATFKTVYKLIWGFA